MFGHRLSLALLAQVDVIQSAPIRKECDKQEGWFADGVLQQLRVLMKEHLRTKLGATSDSSAMLAPTKKRRRQEGQRKQAITASIMGRLTVQQQQQPQLMPTSPVFPQVLHVGRERMVADTFYYIPGILVYSK